MSRAMYTLGIAGVRRAYCVFLLTFSFATTETTTLGERAHYVESQTRGERCKSEVRFN